MEKVLASQVSACFSSLQLTAAFHEMVLLSQHVFRSLNETGCRTAGKALPHPCLKGKKTGLTQDRASRLQFGLTQDQAATHPLLPWFMVTFLKFPIKVPLIHVEMKFICNCVFVLREEL